VSPGRDDVCAMRPDVTVILTVFNRPRLVVEAIESALDPAARARREVIVVDDASTDDTWDVVRAFEPRIRAIRLPVNRGQCSAMSAGVAVAQGEFVKFLDSDDLLVAAHLDEELAVARAAEADIVVSGWGDLAADGTRRETAAPRFGSIADDVLAGKAVVISAALYSRRLDLRCNPEIRKLVDWDLFVNAALQAKKIATCEGVAFWVRQHGAARVTGTATMVAHARAHHAVLRRAEERLRADGRLTPERRLRLAQYFYKGLRVLSLHDREAFEAAVAHIHGLDPRFSPRDEERQRWMRMLARAIGTRNALLLHSALKRRLARGA
jgi:glycosyltransferase involved in cell wall biosynthesis